MSNYLDATGLSYFYQKLKAKFALRSQSLPVIADIARNETTGAMELWSKNLNNIVTTGMYNAITCTNAKFQYSTLIVIGYYLTGYCTQIQQDVTTGRLATRSQINGTWSNWVEIDTSKFYTIQETDAAIAANFASVTGSISNGTISSGATKKLIGDEFKTDVSAAAGYYISAITVTVDGVDVTDQVFTGVPVDDTPSETWETVFNGYGTINEDSSGNYLWISELGNVQIPQNSVWKITWNGTERTHTAVYTHIGNSDMYAIDGRNDGTNAPYICYNMYNAWIVGVGTLTGTIALKIERQITS